MHCGQLQRIAWIKRKHEIGPNGMISQNVSWPEQPARKIKSNYLGYHVSLTIFN